MFLWSHDLSQVHPKGDLGNEGDGKKGDTIMLLNGDDDGKPKRGALCGSHKTVVPNCVRVWFYCSFHGVCVVGFSVVNTQFDDVACNGFRGAPEEESRGVQNQIVAEEVISSVDEEVFAERQLGRMCTRRGCGWLATAQATALVDVPTAHHVFGCGPRSPTRVQVFVRMLGYVLVKQPTVILTVPTP